MRLIFGNPPVNPIPAKEGWRKMPNLGMKAVQLYGLIVSCVGIVLVAVLLHGIPRPSSLWAAALVLVTVLPIHELLHAFTTPGWGRSKRTILGIQSGKNLLLPYAYFDGEQRAWRMLLTGFAPLLVLTALPVAVILLTPLSAAEAANLGFLAFFNMAISGGDLLTVGWILAHLPLRSTVQGNGWALIWKD